MATKRPLLPDPSPSPSPSVPPPLHAIYVPPLSPAAAIISSDTTASSPIDFSPPLIAMVIVIATAFLIITYSRLISKHVTKPILNRFRHWRHVVVSSAGGDVESSSFNPSNSNYFFFDHPAADGYGLDDSVIKTIPLSIYSSSSSAKGGCQSFVVVGTKDCAVCLLEFEENDYVRTLPVCSHNFHVDCIDIWLRSHPNCPLCRARIFRPESPFVPLMASRIRPSFDDRMILESILLDEIQSESNAEQSISEIAAPATDGGEKDETFFNLKRSYSFGFERNFNFQSSERTVLDYAATSPPWRSRRNSFFWNKRLSPFGTLTKSRVFSFRSTRLTKSPFFMRRRRVFQSSRRRASPAASSRLRCGDPEALLSPERYSRR